MKWIDSCCLFTFQSQLSKQMFPLWNIWVKTNKQNKPNKQNQQQTVASEDKNMECTWEISFWFSCYYNLMEIKTSVKLMTNIYIYICWNIWISSLIILRQSRLKWKTPLFLIFNLKKLNDALYYTFKCNFYLFMWALIDLVSFRWGRDTYCNC